MFYRQIGLYTSDTSLSYNRDVRPMAKYTKLKTYTNNYAYTEIIAMSKKYNLVIKITTTISRPKSTQRRKRWLHFNGGTVTWNCSSFRE